MAGTNGGDHTSDGNKERQSLKPLAAYQGLPGIVLPQAADGVAQLDLLGIHSQYIHVSKENRAT